MILLAIKSCWADKDRGFHDIIRRTWALDIQGRADLRFFIGRRESIHDTAFHFLNDDEVKLDVDDSYHALPYKTREILRWFLNTNYQFCWLGDSDTYLRVNRLMNSNFCQYDYMGVNSRPWGVPFPYASRDRAGREHYHPKCHPWASGGFGYTVSRKAAEYIVAAEPDTWAEDLWVGSVLGPLIKEGKIRAKSLEHGETAHHFPQNVFNSGYDPKFGWLEAMYKAEHQ